MYFVLLSSFARELNNVDQSIKSEGVEIGYHNNKISNVKKIGKIGLRKIVFWDF